MYICSLCVCVCLFGSYISNLFLQRFGVNEMTEKSSNAVWFALGPLLVEVSLAAVSSRWSLCVRCLIFSSVQFSSVTQSCPILCDPMNCSTLGLPVQHQLPELTQTYVHWVGDAIQPSHPLSSPSPPVPNPSQHQSLFQWVNSLHEVAKVLEFQL